MRKPHWTATPAQAKAAIAVVSAVREMIELGPSLDAALQAATDTAVPEATVAEHEAAPMPSADQSGRGDASDMRRS